MLDQVDRVELNVRDALLLAGECYKTQQFDKAEELFRAILHAEPTNYDAVNGLALSLAEEGRDFKESLVWFDQAYVMLREEMVALACNRGRALGEIGRSQEALSMFTNLLQSAPGYLLARYNRGLILLQLGRHNEAIADFDAVLKVQPNDGKARFGRGFAKLVQGRYEEGFEDYEYRLKDNIQEPDAPLWTGVEDIKDKTVLVVAEQGFGDNIMFMRYLPKMQEMGARVITHLPKSQQGLANIAGIRTVAGPYPKVDYWVRYMSLARAFRTTSETVPPPVHLSYDEEALAWAANHVGAAGGKLRVGLCWSGSRKSRYDAYRSIPLSELQPLFTLPGVEFFNLQIDVRNSDREAFKALPMTDLTPAMETFSDTAYLMKSLDLVVTVDTAIAHLAGTVGVPTYVMLTSYRTYWLWIEKITHSPWYPSIKLFRQIVDGDWGPVVNAVREGIKQKAPPF